MVRAYARNFITVAEKSSPLWRGGALCATGWSLCPTPRRAPHDTPRPEPPTQTMFARGPVGGGHSGAHSPLSLRRSTINVENVGVRLWQSSAICLRANARSVFYLLDRHALLAMTRGSKGVFLNSLPHPPSCSARHPPPGGRWAF